MSVYHTYQSEVGQMFGQLGWTYWSQLSIIGRLIEETGELAREVNHRYGDKKKRADEAVADIAGELGDILYTLSCFANKNGYDLDHAVARSFRTCDGCEACAPLSIVAQLSRRVGVLAGEVDHYRSLDDVVCATARQSIEGMIGDILLTLECLASSEDLVIETAMQNTFAKVFMRDKNRFPGGT